MNGNDLIEMVDTTVDVHGFELRPNDAVQVFFDIEGRMVPGKVLRITRAKGEIIPTVEGATTQEPPVVTVLLDSGQEVSFEPSFMRMTMWRWSAPQIIRS